MITEIGPIAELAEALQVSLLGGVILILTISGIGVIFAIRFGTRLLHTFEKNAEDDSKSVGIMRDLLERQMISHTDAENRWLSAFKQSNDFQDHQARALERLIGLNADQLGQIKVFEKDSRGWHHVIDEDLSIFKAEIKDLAVRIENMETMVTDVANHIRATPTCTTKGDDIISMLVKIETSLNQLNGKLDIRDS